MATTVADLTRWFDDGIEQGATHMIVVCDEFDHEDYPVYVEPGQDVRKREREYDAKSMQRVMEVYLLDPARRDEQLTPGKLVHNYG